MYSPDLEKLIEAALMDGELTEKEKQVLFKKAEKEGIDLDEFEMMLNARLYEKQQSMKKTETPSVAPKSNKYGDVKKCPNCGAVVKSFQTRCSDCDFEFRDIEAIGSIKNLHDELVKIEKNLIGKKRGLWDKSLEDDIMEAKMRFISTYPIPNTKEDILEFLALAISEGRAGEKLSVWSADSNSLVVTYRKTWRDKAKQVIIKARLALKDDKSAMEEIEYYAKLLEKNLKKGGNYAALWVVIICLLILGGGLGGSFYYLYGFLGKEIKNEKNRLELIVDNINTAIDNSDYNKAEILASQLHWEYYNSERKSEIDELAKQWDKKREDLLSTIDNIKNDSKTKKQKE